MGFCHWCLLCRLFLILITFMCNSILVWNNFWLLFLYLVYCLCLLHIYSIFNAHILSIHIYWALACFNCILWWVSIALNSFFFPSTSMCRRTALIQSFFGCHLDWLFFIGSSLSATQFYYCYYYLPTLHCYCHYH